VTDKDKSDGGCCSPSRDNGAAIAGEQNQNNQADVIALAGAADDGGHEIVEIPGGKSLLGTDNPQVLADEEGPSRTVRLKPFFIDTTAVTNRRFAQFVAATGYQTEAERLGDSFVFKGFLPPDSYLDKSVAAAPWWRMVEGANWRCLSGPEQNTPIRPDDPVVHISWNDATAFAEWAGGRLPSEAEWEHAARGGLGDVMFPWGDQAPDETGFFPCNIWQGTFPDHNTEGDGYFGIAPAKSFAPNGYGLYNMAGNVWEWTAQAFKVKSLRKDIRAAHQGKTGFKVVKGGSYLCHISYCFRYRIAARTANSPDSSTTHQGFRLVYDRPPK